MPEHQHAQRSTTGYRLREYGEAPYRVAVLHGGPGAPGSAQGLARELARDRGVLEPLQTRDSVDGQIAELQEALCERAALPAALVGHSWGAMLAVLFAARHPECVGKLILVSSGPLEAHYAASIMPTRLGRVRPEDRAEVVTLMADLGRGALPEGGLARLGELMAGTDDYEHLPTDISDPPAPAPRADGDVDLSFQPDVHRCIMAEVARLRTEGGFLTALEAIRCPVTAIHGDFDPHPPEGVRDPIAARIPDFRFHLLPHCGHEPWREAHARDAFFALLHAELASPGSPTGS